MPRTAARIAFLLASPNPSRLVLSGTNRPAYPGEATTLESLETARANHHAEQRRWLRIAEWALIVFLAAQFGFRTLPDARILATQVDFRSARRSLHASCCASYRIADTTGHAANSIADRAANSLLGRRSAMLLAA